jgi:hypothetical protein
MGSSPQFDPDARSECDLSPVAISKSAMRRNKNEKGNRPQVCKPAGGSLGNPHHKLARERAA